jgi:hypothetical protein
MSVLSYLDRILTELRQLLELGTVTTIIMRAATLNILAFRDVAANLVRGRSAVAVAAAVQNAAGDDSASRRAHAAAHPHLRNQYASTSNKGPRREP